MRTLAIVTLALSTLALNGDAAASPAADGAPRAGGSVVVDGVVAEPPRPIAFGPEAIVWSEAPASLPPGSSIAVLEGNPRSNALFTMRVRIPAGSSLSPHWHPQAERVTILSGAVEMGQGSSGDPSKVTRYAAGSYYVNQPRTMHYFYFPEETVLQLTCVGPWAIHTGDITAPGVEQSSATVRIVSIAPSTAVDRDTVLHITYDYDLSGFLPDTFTTSLQFESTTPGATVSRIRVIHRPSDDLSLPPQHATLNEPRGRRTIDYEVSQILDAEGVKRPLRFQLTIHELQSPTRSRIAGRSEWITLTER